MPRYDANVFKLPLARPRDSYPVEQYTLHKPTEKAASDIIFSVLTFLEASPLTLRAGIPAGSAAWYHNVEVIIDSLVFYLVSDDDRIRNLACTVARKLLVNGARAFDLRSDNFDLRAYRHTFWKST